MIIIFLTCASQKEAQKIGRALLERKLVACTKMLPVSSSFWWKGKREQAREVLVIFETLEKHWTEIEEVVRKLHSYELPVMFALPVKKTTNDVLEWLDEEIG